MSSISPEVWQSLKPVLGVLFGLAVLCLIHHSIGGMARKSLQAFSWEIRDFITLSPSVGFLNMLFSLLCFLAFLLVASSVEFSSLFGTKPSDVWFILSSFFALLIFLTFSLVYYSKIRN